MKKENKCPDCGKKMKLTCPYEWTMKDEKAFQKGRIEAIEEVCKRIDKLSIAKMLLKAETFTIHSDYPQYREDIIKSELKTALRGTKQ